jgi:hypothetical protein
MFDHKKRSLRRYDPDQVLRVEASGLLSARHTGSPFNFQEQYTAAKAACQDKNLLGFFTPEVYKSIANTALGEDIFWIGWILLQFLAEIVDIEADIMWLIPVLVTPHLGK